MRAWGAGGGGRRARLGAREKGQVGTKQLLLLLGSDVLGGDAVPQRSAARTVVLYYPASIPCGTSHACAGVWVVSVCAGFAQTGRCTTTA